jgi:hypothetical protein
MRELKIMEHISLDGVIQHSSDDGDFPYSDWTAPYRTPAGRDAILAAYGESFDLLLGRRTYDIWSGFWPKAPSSPMADRSGSANLNATISGKAAPMGEDRARFDRSRAVEAFDHAVGPGSSRADQAMFDGEGHDRGDRIHVGRWVRVHARRTGGR